MSRILLTFLLFSVPAAAAAFQGSAPGPAELRELASCRQIADGAERLRCFDDKSSVLSVYGEQTGARMPVPDIDEPVMAQAEPETSPALPPAEPMQESDPDAGFGADNLLERSRRDEKNEMRAVAETFGRTDRGKHIVRLENGQVWRQLQGDTNDLYAPGGLQSGLEVIIKKRSLGSYSLRLASAKRSIRVERVR